MPVSPITVTFDYAQRRMSKDRLSILAQGSWEGTNGRVCGWNSKLFSNIWVDPITFTLMLQPLQLTDGWFASSAGSLARLGTSAFTFNTSSKWTQFQRDCSGDYWLTANDCSNEWALTTATYDRNRGWFISWYGHNTGSDSFKEIEFGWNSSASGASGPSLRVYSSGLVEVWKDNALLGSGSIGGKETQSQTPGQTGSSLAGRWITLIVQPMKRRELLVYSPTTGGGFAWVFDDIAEDDSDSTITPATKFWINRPSGAMDVQACPLVYQTSGYACSDLASFAYPPEIGRAEGTATVYKDDPGYGSSTVTASIVDTDGSTAFVPDGIKQNALAKFALTGSGTCTPFVYGGIVGYTPEFEDCDSSEQADLSLDGDEAVIVEASYQVTERPGDSRFTFKLRYPGASYVSGIESIGNRPVKIAFGNQILMDGRNNPPKQTFGMSEELGYLDFEVRDAWAMLERYTFQEPLPLDGSYLKEALEFILQTAGFDPDAIDIEDPNYSLPVPAGKQAGDWAVCIQVGDTAADWIERLFESYAGNWFYDLVPTADGVKFIARSPAGMDQVPCIEIYETWQEAYDWFIGEGYSESDARSYAPTLVVQTFNAESVAPECNEVRITGVDPRTDKPLQAYKRDYDSMNPTLAPSSRPANWIGELWRYGLMEPALTRQDDVNRCAELLFPRLTSARGMAEWNGRMLFKPDGSPVWKGDVVSISGRGEYRVTAFTVQFTKEPGTDTSLARTAHYMAEKIDDADQPWRGKYSASDIQTIKELKRIGIQAGGSRRGSYGLVSKSPGNSEGV